MKDLLYDYQFAAVEKMKNGCILNGGVGSGKSRTALYYYFKTQGGKLNPYKPMRNPKDLYIITTAMKRNSLEFEKELCLFQLSTNPSINYYKNKVIVDSWNNIKKYKKVYNSFFIFDEDKITGSGVWAKTFLDISRKNRWIVLSATPGDTWTDYITIFVANGFYKNKTDFYRQHCVFSRYTKYPKIDYFVNTKKLIKERDDILVPILFERKTVEHHEDIFVGYDIKKYKEAMRSRWDPYKDKPMQQASDLCYILRRIVNEAEERQVALLELLEKHERAIIFYNFNYELDILKLICNNGKNKIAEWNGFRHEEIPKSKRWVYLVQYTAGAEGWNCIKTDTIIFYSQNYSYKTMVQASGRINRLNTPYTDLYYYHLKSRSSIDIAISKALNDKKIFNETKFIKW